MTAKKTVATKQPDTMLALLRDAVTSSDVSVDKMRDLFELSREVEKDTDRREFHSRMAQLQAEIAPIATDASNPQTQSKYASYAALDKALRPHYTRHGFSVSFDSAPSEKGDEYTKVTCIVSYGAWTERSSVDMPINTKGAKGNQVMTITHAMGSALSYGKRYSLAMAFNIAVSRDDDGNRAAERCVTASQAAELLKLAEGHNTTALFERLEITEWEDLPQSQYNRVVSWIKTQKQKEATQ